MGLLPGIWHVATRPARPRLADVDRRAVVRTGALVLAGGAMWRAIDGLYRMGGIPPRRFTGSHARGSDDPDRMPVTQWLFDTVPHLDPAVWELTVADRLGTRRLQLADLRGLPQTDRRVVLDCTGGWYAAQTWSGVPLAVLLDHVGARRVVVTSHTGYARAFPIGVADDLLLALDVAGLPLSAGHGAPARLVAPGRRGFWWVKWVRHIAVDDVPAWIQPPFPVQ
jgi:DMSO/TMAO reductase YedYZ molybdopterin-dependent catalytic subunit